MLYLNNPYEIDGITVYPDSNEGNVFYPIPAMPRFRRDEKGEPVFHLLKFRGGGASSAPKVGVPTDSGGKNDELTANSVPMLGGEPAGAILSFDTEFGIDQETQERIRLRLDELERAKALALGNPLPDTFQIILRQPTWTDGNVDLIIEGKYENELHDETISKGHKPSLMGNNVAAFGAVLYPWQASVMQAAITDRNFTPIQVAYHLKFLAKVPPVRITIWASADDCYRMYKEYGDHPNKGTCSNTDQIVRAIREKAYSRRTVRVTIDSGGLKIDDETFKKLQEFAFGLLQQWIQQEFLKPPPERATKEQLGEFTLKTLSRGDFRDLNIHIDQSATVEFEINPQSTMERLIKEGEDLQKFVTEVDLSRDQFYQNREASVKVYADFPISGAPEDKSDLKFVEVTLRYGTEAKSMTWDVTGSATTTANGGRWDVTWHKIPNQNEIQWEARVYFRDPTHKYTLTGSSDKTQINIPVASPGRAQLQVMNAGIPWKVIPQIELDLSYSNPNAEPQTINDTLILTQEKGEPKFDAVIWTQWKPPFMVTPRYMLSDGTTIQGNMDRVESNRYIVHSPFKEWLTIQIIADSYGSNWEKDIIDLEYRDDANNYVSTGQIFLSTEGGYQQAWSVPLMDPSKRAFTCRWTRIDKLLGISTSTDLTEYTKPAGAILQPGGVLSYTGDSSIPVITGDPSFEGNMLKVIVDPLVFTTGLLSDPNRKPIKIIVHLMATQNPNDIDDHTFTATDLTAWEWMQFIRDREDKKYRWWADYYVMNPYQKISVGDRNTDCLEETLMLPPV